MMTMTENPIAQIILGFLGIALLISILFGVTATFVVLRKVKYSLLSSLVISLFMSVSFFFGFFEKGLKMIRNSTAEVACLLGGVEASEFKQRMIVYTKENLEE